MQHEHEGVARLYAVRRRCGKPALAANPLGAILPTLETGLDGCVSGHGARQVGLLVAISTGAGAAVPLSYA